MIDGNSYYLRIREREEARWEMEEDARLEALQEQVDELMPTLVESLNVSFSKQELIDAIEETI
jgi:hypothetical protein